MLDAEACGSFLVALRRHRVGGDDAFGNGVSVGSLRVGRQASTRPRTIKVCRPRTGMRRLLLGAGGIGEVRKGPFHLALFSFPAPSQWSRR